MNIPPKLLIVLGAAIFCTGDTTPDESEAITSLNEIDTLSVIGDSIVIVAKNETDADASDLDEFEKYLQNHILRVKSPMQEDKTYDFDLTDLIPIKDTDGRSRRQSVKKPLLPLLLLLKIKTAVLIPILLKVVALIAAKGFWAGMTALFISTAIAFKVLYHTQNDHDTNPHEDNDDFEYQEEHHVHHGHHHSHPHYYHEIPYHHHAPPPRLEYQEHHVHKEKEKPIVIYVNSDRQTKSSANRYDEPPIKEYYPPETWDPWGREYTEYDRTRWENGPSSPLSPPPGPSHSTWDGTHW